MSSGVIDGQSVNAAITNAAFLTANGPSTGVGVLGLAEAASSGPAIANVQNTINVLINSVGGNQSTPATAYPTVPANTITTGSTHQQALIDLSLLFHNSTGHAHDGTQGDGAPISFGSLTGTQLQGYAIQGTAISAASGASSDVTSLLTGSVNSYGQTFPGVVSNAPYNYIQIFDENGDNYISASGNKVFGRLTASPATATSPTAWTLSYYQNAGGIEVSYALPASSYVNWYYQQLFTEGTRPVYSDAFSITSDQVAGIVPDATAAIKGKVMLATSAQSVGSANSAGTANAVAANADHVHRGISSLASSGGSALYGDVTIAASGVTQVSQNGQSITVFAPASGAAVNALNGLTGSVTIAASGVSQVGVSGQTINVYAPASGAAVNALSATGFSPLTGSVVIAPSGAAQLSQSGQTITVFAPASGAAVNSLAASGFSPLTGAITIAASGGTLLGQSGQVITVYAPTGGGGVTSLAASGQTALTGAVTLSASGGITLTQSGQNIQIFSASGGGNGGGPGFTAALNLMLLDTSANSWGATKTDNFNAESTVGDWLAYADAAGTVPVDMTGGTPNSTVTRTTSAINGAGSFLLTVNSGASRQGEGASCLVNVPTAYRGQTLFIRFPFSTTGTLVEDDFRIYAYDVTNSTLITPTTFSKILGASGQVYAQFPVSTNTAQVRVGIHIARTSTGAATITFDDVSLSNVSVPAGMAGSDWLAYTPTFTGFGTVSTQNFRYRRVGDSIEIQGRFTFGTPTATEARLSLPLNLTIDSSIDTLELAGWAARDAVSTNYDFAVLAEPSVSYFTFGNSVGGSAAVLAKQNGNALGGSGNICAVQARIKITGWSSNVSMGESSSFLISSYIANGTRVTSTPTKLGEYRTYVKNSSSYAGTDNAPATAPSASNGMLIYAVPYASAGTSGQTNRWEVFVGKNKNVKAEYYQSSGRTGYADARPLSFGEAIVFGVIESYDPSTGVMVIDTHIQASGTTVRESARDLAGGALSSVYFDIKVSENALSVSSQQPRSEIVLHTGNGYGSTNTVIRRFSTLVSSIGTAVTYADSATAGASFTINEDGVYAISYGDRRSSGVMVIGISVNSNQLTTAISSITASHRIAYVEPASDYAGQAFATVPLRAGDVVRPHSDGAANTAGVAQNYFRICKVSN